MLCVILIDECPRVDLEWSQIQLISCKVFLQYLGNVISFVHNKTLGPVVFEVIV